MGLETATFISGLDATNPVGATDPKSAGDDHLRLLKSTILATFAAITGAVTASHTELNRLAGVTGVEGSGKLVLALASALPALSGAALTALNASNLGSGTVPDARFPATLPALSGVNLTALNASNIASGTLADARLSANVPLLNAANTFTGASLTVSASNSFLRATDSAVQAFMQALGAGSVSLGSNTAHPVDLVINGVSKMRVDGSGNFDFKAGLVTNTGASAQQVGFNGIPNVGVTSSDYTFGAVLALAEANWSAGYNGSGGNTFTIPANSAKAWAVGTTLHIFNIGSGTLTIALTSDTLKLAGTASTGSRTLAVNGVATAEKVASTTWIISGVGLS